MNILHPKLSVWYSDNKRDLPWRNTQNPYFIWLSEIILQQTRVAQGMSYYLRFVQTFPTVKDLALAEEDLVLRLWQGLGYYSRARNLHIAAKFIYTELDGVFPSNFADIRKLKGVGDYTAAAIASFAYGEVVPVLDGNVYRVISRIFGLEHDILQASSRTFFIQVLEREISKANPALFNQAIMEFGALHCTPKNANCEGCIFSKECYAWNNKLVYNLPVKTKKSAKKVRYFNYIVYRFEDKIAFQKRDTNDIWNGLYQFILLEEDDYVTEDILSDKIKLEHVNKIIWFEPNAKHLLSHQTIFSQMILVELNETNALPFYSQDEIQSLPKPILIENFLKKYIYKTA